MDNGLFYLIQLIPEYNPGRLKIGFTNDLQRRVIKQHTPNNPTLKLVKTWPCLLSWERSFISMMHSMGRWNFMSHEVMEYDNVPEVIRFCDDFFYSREHLLHVYSTWIDESRLEAEPAARGR